MIVRLAVAVCWKVGELEQIGTDSERPAQERLAELAVRRPIIAGSWPKSPIARICWGG